MTITIEINCPHCHSANATRNGKKSKGKQNYRRKDCSRQFISDHERARKGTLSWIKNTIKIMLARGSGMRDIGIIPGISMAVVLKTLEPVKYRIKPKRTRYDCLETDEFWTYAGKRRTKYGLFTRIAGKAGKQRHLCGGKGI
jgi:transposase-like protein